MPHGLIHRHVHELETTISKTVTRVFTVYGALFFSGLLYKSDSPDRLS